MGLSVIGAGFGRTGTNSFQVAMEMIGFAPCHHMFVLMNNPGSVDAWVKAAEDTLINWDEIYGDFAATCDFPHCVFYEELAEFYPLAKVVLTVRDPESWYQSATQTIFSPENMERMSKGGTDGTGAMAQLAGPLGKVMSRVIDFKKLGDKQVTIDSFNRYNEKVQATIPPDRLLVYEVSEGWEPLCNFLEVPVPVEPFPFTNTTDEFLARGI